MATNLHHSCKPDKILEDLKDKGFKAIEVSMKLKYRTKEPLNMFMLTFSPEEDINNIYKISSILRCNVAIQPVKRIKLIHTKNYCNNGPRCVKCAENHYTNMCAKPENVQPKCVHCKGAHPANYRGCKVAIEKQNIKNKAVNLKGINPNEKNSNKTVKTNTLIKKPKTGSVPSSATVIGKKTFAQVVSSNNNNQSNNKIDIKRGNIAITLDMILTKLESFDERLKAIELTSKRAPSKHKNGQHA